MRHYSDKKKAELNEKENANKDTFNIVSVIFDV